MRVLIVYPHGCNSAGQMLGIFRIKLFERILGVVNIFYYTARDPDVNKNFNKILEKYNIDAVVFEDEDFIEKIPLDINAKVILFKHGTDDKRPFDLCLNQTLGSWGNFAHLHGPLSEGNMFKCIDKSKNRPKKIAIFSRLCKFHRSLLEDALEFFKIDKIDAYVPREDGEEVEQEIQQILEMVELKGKVSRKELYKYYNQYDAVLIPSRECTSNTMREALMCGCVPFVDKTLRRTRMTFFTDVAKFLVSSEDGYDFYNMMKEYIRKDSTQEAIHDYMSMEQMILNILIYLRGLTLEEFKWAPQQRVYKRRLSKLDPVELQPNYEIAVNWSEVML